MNQKLCFTIILALFTAFSINTLEAQTEEKTKIVIKKKVVDKDGNVTEEITELEGEEADLFILKQHGEDGDEIEIEIDRTEDMEDAHEVHEVKRYRVKVLDEDGNEEEIIWNGEGEMPEEMKEAMEKHEMRVEKNGYNKFRAKFIGEDGEQQEIEWEGEGEMPDEIKEMIEKKKEEGGRVHLNHNSESYVVKIEDEDGSKKTMKWNGEGEMPEDIKKMLEEHDIDIDMDSDGDLKVVMVEEDKNTNKAQLGVMIENAPTGVLVKGFAESSPAEAAGIKSGDVITQVDGVVIKDMEALIKAIGEKEVGDILSITYIRGGEEIKTDVKLSKRTASKMRKFKWKEVEKN